ncbi:hypothetical protein ACFL27_20965, partial [candidate division CSSED10-310 bacterium]
MLSDLFSGAHSLIMLHHFSLTSPCKLDIVCSEFREMTVMPLDFSPEIGLVRKPLQPGGEKASVLTGLDISPRFARSKNKNPDPKGQALGEPLKGDEITDVLLLITTG